jgi:hypothetical protein
MALNKVSPVWDGGALVGMVYIEWRARLIFIHSFFCLCILYQTVEGSRCNELLQLLDKLSGNSYWVNLLYAYLEHHLEQKGWPQVKRESVLNEYLIIFIL